MQQTRKTSELRIDSTYYKKGMERMLEKEWHVKQYWGQMHLVVDGGEDPYFEEHHFLDR